MILYGCGDFLDDYEGISGYEEFRGDLGLMYFPTVAPLTGELLELRMFPTRIKSFRVNKAENEDARWLAEMLEREGKPLGTRVAVLDDGSLSLCLEP